MTGNVHKLALDFGFRWLVPIQLLMTLAVDDAYLRTPLLSAVTIGGVLLALQGSFSMSKVALWRILPVTDREIGRARWWQMIGIPGIAIVAIMALAIALHALAFVMGRDRHVILPDALTLLRAVLGQFFYAVILSVFVLVTNFLRAIRSPLATPAMIAAIIAFLGLFLLPHALLGLSLESRALWLGAAGLVTAAILFATAPRWPQPVTQPMQLELSGSNSRAAPSNRSGGGGWTSLCGMALIRPLPMLALFMALWVTMILALGPKIIIQSRLFIQLQLLIPLAVITQITQFNATALRMLRALPGSTINLTAYLFFLPLALIAVVSIGVSLILQPWLTETAPRIDAVALSAVLLGGAMALPAALAVRQIAMSIVIMLAMIPVALIQFGWDYVPLPWQDQRLLAGLTMAAIGVGFFWMHVQISRGTRVYRLQPFVAARWRGDS